ncbi:MAG TPA: UvrD-helicase domain-containing protein, partial [Clostridia bacterium]|nr:UvrD-helicase domain-containing protein [Clostridia bacterium]
MDIISSKLNDRQREAVLAEDGPVLVLAGAGSGKTSVLTNRLAYLVKEKGIRPHSIMAITFTNKAAREIRERVGRIFGESIWFPWAGTFHSICLKMLRMYPESLGYRPGFAIYDQDDQATLVRDCLKELNMDSKIFPPKMIVHHISRAKDELIDPKKFKESNAGDYKMSGVAEVYELYQKHMLENNAMDFGDLIFNAVLMLENFANIRSYFQNAFRHILIDEYQDTNLAQYRLANILSQIHGNIFVVGDDDQSIYGWRGADIRNILEFEKDYMGCRVIKLEQNYRSTKNILAAAN